MDRRSFLTGALVAGAVAGRPGSATAVAAESEAAQVAKRKINIAGRQRMLTQRMAKAACFAHIGIEPEMHRQQMADAHALFDLSLRALRYGDPDLGLTRETKNAVNAGLARVAALWEGYGIAVERAFSASSVGRNELDVIVGSNLGILAEMNKTVGITERAYGGSEIPLHLAIAINIAGRQRMLSQKMSKELCMIAAGYDAGATRAVMGETVQYFDLSLLALRNGMDAVGIRPPRTDAVKDQLAVVAGIWADVLPPMTEVVAGGAPSEGTLTSIASVNNTLLAEMNKAVFLYEGES